MMRVQRLGVWLHSTWIRFKTEERGAQTLEWLALALLILAILGTAAGLSGGEFSKALKEKFLSMVNKIDSKQP